jgi:hypothetical protein
MEPSGPSNTAQGRDLALYMVNTAFSKDILKKRLLSFNVSDIFNSVKEDLKPICKQLQ